MPTITDWLMVIITLVYVIATIFICVANINSSKAAKEQTAEMKKQFLATNRPNVAAEIVYLKRTFWVLRFVNHGSQTAYNTKIILNKEFIDSVEDSFKKPLQELENKVCTIGVNQHYDIFIGANEFRNIENKKKIIGQIISHGIDGSIYSDDFEIDTENYVTFFSVNSENEDLIKELKTHNKELNELNRNLKSKK